MNYSRIAIVLGAVIILSLVVFLFSLPPTGLWSGDQGAKWFQLLALERSGFRISPLPNPAHDLFPDNQFSSLPIMMTKKVKGRTGSGSNRKFYSVYSYSYAYFAALAHYFFGVWGVYLPSLIGLAGILLVYWLIARRLVKPKIALLMMPMLVFATPVAFYSVVVWEHSLAAALTTGAIYLAICSIERIRAPKPSSQRC